MHRRGLLPVLLTASCASGSKGAVAIPEPAPIAAGDVTEPTPAPVPVAGPCPGDMVLVPGGTFAMGSPPGVGREDEHAEPRGARTVTLSPYCLDRTEVTVAAYAACGSCTPAADTVEWDGIDDADRARWNDVHACNANRPDRQDHPVNCVTWSQADTYCRSLGKRLPTEAQWELAARGTDGRTYPWGDESPAEDLLNASGAESRALAERLGNSHRKVMYEADDGYDMTAPVDIHPGGASPYGALDMAGNVLEWVADEHASYQAGAFTDPAPAQSDALEADKRYVLRGGAWIDIRPANVRSAFRESQRPWTRHFAIGFRCERGTL